MKIEVMVDKDNTHFSYKFDCDKVIDGSRLRAEDSLGIKLVIMKKLSKSKEQSLEDYENHGRYDTIAVFNTWTFWRVIEDTEACQAAESEANEPSDREGIKRR